MADRRLQVFHTVAKVMSFTKAAETLHMTQPAVTFQMPQCRLFKSPAVEQVGQRVVLGQPQQVMFRLVTRLAR